MKSSIILSEDEVECPANNCSTKVKHQRKVFKKSLSSA